MVAALVPLLASANVTITPRGQAMTSVALAVPPGIAGMAPALSLTYADGGINGPLGVGWSLQGVSSITRCPATKYVDGKARSVRFDADDRLCLDGQRLIPLTAATAAIGSAQPASQAAGLSTGFLEFRTAQDSFARIRAYGIGPSGNLADGPKYFRVWTKSGQIYDYGVADGGNTDTNGAILPTLALAPAPTAKGISVWPVTRVSDSMGNYMDFRYGQRDVDWGSGTVAQGDKGREWYLAEIQYTGKGGQGGPNMVVFQYDERPADALPGHDRSEAIQVDRKNVSVLRLVAVRTYVNFPATGRVSADPPLTIGAIPATALKVETYKLGYERSGFSGRSRLTSITECAGSTETACLPPTRMTYTNLGSPSFVSNTSFVSSTLSTTPLLALNGDYGMLTGDFNGDGRTDILRWGRNPSNSQLWLSSGNGSFTQSTSFNITTKPIEGDNGCYKAVVADFNGDGLSDILVAVQKPGCAYPSNRLYLSQVLNPGAFTETTLPVGMDLSETLATLTVTATQLCQSPQVVPTTPSGSGGVSSTTSMSGATTSTTTPDAATCYQHTKTVGRRFYVLDVDGDGLLDIVTSTEPAYSYNSGAYSGPAPSSNDLCNGSFGVSTICTRVWRQDSTGTFTLLGPDMAYKSLYSDPWAPRNSNPYWKLPGQADINGDGLQDILAKGGRWVSKGDGTFEPAAIMDGSQVCSAPIDFNGDGRGDCLSPSSATQLSAQALRVSYGSQSSGPLAQFNITAGATYPDALYGTDANGVQNVGVVVQDFDGDGRDDILRWGQTPSTDNKLYLSNGNGSFRLASNTGLNVIGLPFQKTDGSTSFVLGDFIGNGTIQLLHVVDTPSSSKPNLLYARTAGTSDLLATLTTPTGLTTAVGSRVSITSAGAPYTSDRGTSKASIPTSTQPQLDIQVPMYVVPSITQETGAGSLTTSFSYKGMKAFRDGSGDLGFREFSQQVPTPNGTTTTSSTEYVLQRPYSGSVIRSWSVNGGVELERVTNVYCDKTSTTSPSSAGVDTPCTTAKLVTRPYLYSSTQQRRDLNNAALPTVSTVTTYNDWGDPTQIVVTTTGTVAGATRTQTKTVTNTYCNPTAAWVAGGACPKALATADGDRWVLGRLINATVTNSVPELVSSGALATSAGSAPLASATTGVGQGLLKGLPPIISFLLD